MLLGNTTYWGILSPQKNYEVGKFDNVTYLVSLVNLTYALSTDNTVFWRGANPY